MAWRAQNLLLIASILFTSIALCAHPPKNGWASAQVPVKPASAPERLLSQLKSRDVVTRRATANHLGTMRAINAVPPLIESLFDSDATVREAAAFALGQIADQNASGPLVGALADTDAEVRASAAFALGMLGGVKAAEALSSSLGDPEPAVRASVVAALGLMQDAEGVEEIIGMLDDPSFDVRYDAAWALGQIGEADAMDHLRVALVNADILKAPESLREVFRQTVQNSLETIKLLSDDPTASEATSRPRRVAEPPKKEEAVALSNETRAASVQKSVQPAPTERALRARARGTVGLRLLINMSGRPVRAYVTRRLGYGLDQRAVEAAMQYRYDPAMRNGLSQVDWVNLDIKF